MKRFRIVIFNENYSGSNYDDYKHTNYVSSYSTGR